jgi:hypothetical protein
MPSAANLLIKPGSKLQKHLHQKAFELFCSEMEKEKTNKTKKKSGKSFFINKYDSKKVFLVFQTSFSKIEGKKL